MTKSHLSTILRRHEVADVWFNTATQHHSLLAARSFKKGELIVRFHAGIVQKHPTYLTIQTGIERHITLIPDYLQFVNHSCDPTVFFDTASMGLTAIKQIRTGDELCFFYPSTEWVMAQPFVCNCGSTDCLKVISGAAQLEFSTLVKYRLTKFITDQFRLKI